MTPKCSNLVWYPWDILEVMWLWGWKVKGQGHRVNKCIFRTTVCSVQTWCRKWNCLCCQMNVLSSTKRMQELERKFECELVERSDKVRASKPPVELPPRTEFIPCARSSPCAGKSLVCLPLLTSNYCEPSAIFVLALKFFSPEFFHQLYSWRLVIIWG